jgi:hypothetical protein
MLDRCHRHGRVSSVAGMGGSRGQYRSGHAYTARIGDHRGDPPLSGSQQAAKYAFEGKWYRPVTTTDFLTWVF